VLNASAIAWVLGALVQYNKEILIDAVVHAVNEDYLEMAGDFTRLGFLAPGTDVQPLVPALEAIWQNSTGQSLADFNFRSVTGAAPGPPAPRPSWDRPILCRRASSPSRAQAGWPTPVLPVGQLCNPI